MEKLLSNRFLTTPLGKSKSEKDARRVCVMGGKFIAWSLQGAVNVLLPEKLIECLRCVIISFLESLINFFYYYNRDLFNNEPGRINDFVTHLKDLGMQPSTCKNYLFVIDLLSIWTLQGKNVFLGCLFITLF